jgi:hypothetical protein
MRFRTGLFLGGVIGYLVGRELARRDTLTERPPDVLRSMARHPSNRFTLHGRRFAERAGWRGVEALQRARANIQRRLDPDVSDLSPN